jgi:hypothetical protein
MSQHTDGFTPPLSLSLSLSLRARHFYLQNVDFVSAFFFLGHGFFCPFLDAYDVYMYIYNYFMFIFM